MKGEKFLNYSENNRKPDNHPIITEAFKKAEAVTGGDDLSMSNFVETYGKNTVETDEQIVADLSKNLEYQGHEKATAVLEAIIFEQAELGEWLGKNIQTVKTNSYDEIVNGVSIVAEQNDDNNPDSYSALGIDIAFEPKAMNRKLLGIQNEIKRDKPATVKYHESNQGVQEPLEHIPKVVLGVDIKIIKELSRLWVDNDKKGLEQHPFAHYY